MMRQKKWSDEEFLWWYKGQWVFMIVATLFFGAIIFGPSIVKHEPWSYSDDSSPYETGESSSGCTSDCSGHDAGYEYGREYDICDSSYSNGKSESFNDGVRKWAENNC